MMQKTVSRAMHGRIRLENRNRNMLSWCIVFIALAATSCSLAGKSISAADTPTAYISPADTHRMEPSSRPTLEVATNTTTASEAPTPAIDSVGPWLVYSAGLQINSEQEVSADRIYIVNKDGTGKTAISLSGYQTKNIPILEDISNRLVLFSDRVYLLRPFQVTAFRLTNGGFGYVEPTMVAWNGESGHLASSRQVNSGAFAEIFIHALPGGAVEKTIPLVQCEDGVDCLSGLLEFANRTMWARDPVGGLLQYQWSPDGRYLAYVAATGFPDASGVYLYDTTDGGTNLLTNGYNEVGKLFWSPDGKYIVFETLSPEEEEMWTIQLDGGSERQLYSAPRYANGQKVLEWLSDEEFLSTDGFYEIDDCCNNLRLVNAQSGKVQIIYPSGFHFAVADPKSKTVVLYIDGLYLLHPGDEHPTPLNSGARPYWNSTVSKFVTSERCEDDERYKDDERYVLAFSISGVWSCIRDPQWVEEYPSPDGNYKIVRVDDGTWVLDRDGARLAQISPQRQGEIVWRPDSMGFFSQAESMLRYFSIPDLSIRVVEEQIYRRHFFFQWL